MDPTPEKSRREIDRKGGELEMPNSVELSGAETSILRDGELTGSDVSCWSTIAVSLWQVERICSE